MLARSVRANQTHDIGDLLIAQLMALFSPDANIRLNGEKPWASITFSGTRYGFEVKLPSGCPDAQLQSLPDHEFDLPGHFVADVLIHERRHDAAFTLIEILTIADPVSEKCEPAIG